MSRITAYGSPQVAHGHMSWLGRGLLIRKGAIVPAKGHRAYLGNGRPTSHDNQAALLPLVMAERHRRALYAACDRAPEFTARHANLAGVGA